MTPPQSKYRQGFDDGYEAATQDAALSLTLTAREVFLAWRALNALLLLDGQLHGDESHLLDKLARCAHPLSAERDGAVNAKDNPPATGNGSENADSTDRQPRS